MNQTLQTIFALIDNRQIDGEEAIACGDVLWRRKKLAVGSSSMNMAEFAVLGKKRLEEFTQTQSELFDKLQKANRLAIERLRNRQVAAAGHMCSLKDSNRLRAIPV